MERSVDRDLLSWKLDPQRLVLLVRGARQVGKTYYWHREGRDTNAEVDYVIQRGERIVPLEVKSGARGSMQSMRIFLRERNLPCGIRLSQENASRNDGVLSLPLYCAGMLTGRPC